ncbi:MAG: 30S ribosomal protein S17 [Patescibacteria group bacterium]
MEKKQINPRKFEGQVVSAAMKKTIAVRVDAMKLHEKYNKSYKVSRKYLVHDEKSEAKLGDIVSFVECRPLSKTKRWRLVEVLKKNT